MTKKIIIFTFGILFCGNFLIYAKANKQDIIERYSKRKVSYKYYKEYKANPSKAVSKTIEIMLKYGNIPEYKKKNLAEYTKLVERLFFGYFYDNKNVDLDLVKNLSQKDDMDLGQRAMLNAILYCETNQKEYFVNSIKYAPSYILWFETIRDDEFKLYWSNFKVMVYKDRLKGKSIYEDGSLAYFKKMLLNFHKTVELQGASIDLFVESIKDYKYFNVYLGSDTRNVEFIKKNFDGYFKYYKEMIKVIVDKDDFDLLNVFVKADPRGIEIAKEIMLTKNAKFDSFLQRLNTNVENVSLNIEKLKTQSAIVYPMQWIDKEILLGKINPGEKVVVKTLGINQSVNKVLVDKVETSCGCSNAKVSAKTVDAGKDLEIELTYTGEKKPGKFTKSILIYYKGIENPQVIRFSGEVVK